MAGRSDDPGRTVLSRAIAILDSFSHDRPEQTLASIVRETGLAPATVHRLLAELVEWGGLERSARGRYRIGLRLWQLGALAPGSRRLRDAALPYLEDLYEATHQVVHLAVLDAGKVLYVEKLSAKPEGQAVATASEVGKRLPLHATGPGKVLLAFSPPQLQEEVLAGELTAWTPYTITDRNRLRRSLADVRRVGVCISRDEMTLGASSVAAPVFNADRTVAAAVSVVVPSSTESLTPLIPVVRAACLGITRALRQFGGPVS